MGETAYDGGFGYRGSHGSHGSLEVWCHRQVSDFLEMTGVPEAHGALQAKGLLHEWQPGTFEGRQ